MEMESQASRINGAASREWSPPHLLPSDPAAKMQPAVFAVEIKDAPYEGASNPFGFWDPLGLSELGSERTQAWFKAAETKHGLAAEQVFRDNGGMVQILF